MRRRWLTGRGVGSLIVGILFVLMSGLVSSRPLMYVGVLFAALPLIAAIVVYAPQRRATVVRMISPELLSVGQTSRVTVRCEMRTVVQPNALWFDTLPDAVRGDATGEYFRGTRVLSYELDGVTRGTFTLGPLVLRTADPFGLAQREQPFGETRAITITPQVLALDPLPTKVGAAGGSAQTRSNRLGQGADNLIPRPYSAGDSRRRIHWRATAHRGDLMVRQEEEESSPDALVVLDRARAHWPMQEATADAGFEAAVSLCASAAVRLEHDGYSVDVIDSAGATIAALRGHEENREDLLTTLANLTRQGEPRDLRSVVGAVPPGPLVYITGILTLATAEKLRTTGAAAPLLLAAYAEPGALDAAAAHGWRVAELDPDDPGASWSAVLHTAVAHG